MELGGSGNNDKDNDNNKKETKEIKETKETKKSTSKVYPQNDDEKSDVEPWSATRRRKARENSPFAYDKNHKIEPPHHRHRHRHQHHQ